MDSTAPCRASVIQTTQRSATHGQGSVFASQASQAPIAIDPAPPTHLARIAFRCALAKTTPTANQKTARVYVVQAGLAGCVTRSVRRANTGRTASTSAVAKTGPCATLSQVSASALLAGRGSSATKSVLKENTARTVQRPVTAKTEPLVITSQAPAPAPLVTLVPHATSHAPVDILVVSASTDATALTPTPTGATMSQEDVSAARAGKANDVTLSVLQGGGGRPVQRSVSVIRARATN